MTILSKARCFVCGSIIRLDPNGDWHCPVCGAYDGNGHIEWLDGEEVDTQMSVDDGKFYWLKLKRDFFKRHDIRIIEDMPNGTDYVLFYLKLLVESIDHNGNLRFSDQIPYSEDMLASVTNTNIDIVRSAVRVFVELGMMELLDDGTLFMRQVESMIGSAANNDNANRQRSFRARKKQLLLQESYDSVTNSNESKSKSKSKSKNLELEKEKEKDTLLSESACAETKTKRFVPPTAQDVAAYCTEKGYNIDAEYFVLYYEARGWMLGKQKMKSWRAAVATWVRNDNKRNGQDTVSPKTEESRYDENGYLRVSY